MHRCIALLSLALLPNLSDAADWKQFRGPGGTGVSAEKNLPVEWSAKKNLHWKAALPGRGLSNPVVAGGRIFVTASSDWQQKRLHVLCFNEAGKKLWERQFWATGTAHSHPKTSMAAPTPVTDGENVFALFATHDLVGLDKRGNLLWFRSLTGDYPTVGNNVGMASSPVLWKGVLLLALENAGKSFALGINKKTGVNLWRRARPRGINWVTPLVLEHGGKPQVVFQSPEEMAAYHPQTGKPLWKRPGVAYSKIPSPVFAGGLILTQAKQFLALRPESDNKKPKLAWKTRKLRCGYSSPLYYKGLVYTLTSAGGILRCADAGTGDVLWSQRLGGNYAASLVAGDDKIYAVSEEGKTTVVKAARKWNPVAANSIKDKILATPVIANGAIYLRSDKFLYCIKKK